MKYRSLLPLLLLFVGALLASFSSSKAEIDDIPIKISKKADAVIQNKCYGCHSPDAKGDKSKAALNWDELSGLDNATQLEKLNNIASVISKGSMPPKKFLEKMPEKALTAAETAAMSKWVSKAIKKAEKKMKKMM